MDLNSFTLPTYAELIKHLRERGWIVSLFKRHLPEGPRRLWLRHDVDVDLDYAVKFAEFEMLMNVRSTYFLMVDTEQYNVASSQGRKAIQRIRECGHDIGVHVRVSSDMNVDQLRDCVRKQCMVFKVVTGTRDIDVISFHKPPNKVRLLTGAIMTRRHNVYAPPFFYDDCYTSDSTGRWRFDSPLESQWYKRKLSAQLLIHPIWWVTGRGMAKTKLQDYLDFHINRASERLREELECDF